MTTASTIREIVVDDTDPQLIYTGSWTVDAGSLDRLGTYGPIHNNTSHGASADASVTFTFTGTAIVIYGTNQTTPNSLSYACTLDSIQMTTPAVTPTPQNNWILCMATKLTYDTHTIILNVTSVSSSSPESSAGTVWVDYIQYRPIPTANITNDVVIHVPSNDFGIKYSAGWGTLAAFQDVDEAFYTQNDNAYIQFPFIGTQISWSGWFLSTYPHNPATATYTIDNSSSLSSTFELGNTPATNVTIPHNIFFTSPVLPYGLHTLVVTYDGGPANQSIGGPTPLNLGYLLVTGTSYRLTDTETTTTSTSSSSTATTTATVTAIAGGSNGSKTSNGGEIGAIVGGILGGILVIVTAILLYLILQRRHRRKSGVMILKAEQPVLEPFLLTRDRPRHPQDQYAPPPESPPTSSGSRSIRTGSMAAGGIFDSHMMEDMAQLPTTKRKGEAGWSTVTSLGQGSGAGEIGGYMDRDAAPPYSLH
ncbi:hypothetical protein H0H92_005898 [Tricholoma furcatifolium]|nr:hypothetical protein H0H92_005898 [Tricholoma furcatifolium]